MVKIFRFFVNVIFIIIIVLLVGYLLFRITDKVEIYKVKTGSMEEKIHVGDYILIYRQDHYSVGEVVTYTSNDGFITHRIIKKEGNKITTKGDANNAEDNEIIESTIVGKVIISGGILNIIIDYKYMIVCALLSLYLFSCYFGNGKQEKLKNSDELKEDINEELEEAKEEVTEEKIEVTEETSKEKKTKSNKKKKTETILDEE